MITEKQYYTVNKFDDRKLVNYQLFYFPYVSALLQAPVSISLASKYQENNNKMVFDYVNN